MLFCVPCHAVDAPRIDQTRLWVVFLSNLRPFGPRCSSVVTRWRRGGVVASMASERVVVPATPSPRRRERRRETAIHARTHERRLRGNTRARLNGTGVMSAPRGSNRVFREARRPLVVLALMVLLSMLQSQSVEIVGAILEVTARMSYFTLGL